MTLLDPGNNVMVEYRIGYVSSTSSFEIPYSSFVKPPPLARKVKIQQDQKAEYLTLAEIEVYDTSNVNQALNKGATENPPHPDFPATNGIDGSTTTFFSTEKAQGVYSILLWGIGYIMYVHYVNSLLRIQYRRLVDG